MFHSEHRGLFSLWRFGKENHSGHVLRVYGNPYCTNRRLLCFILFRLELKSKLAYNDCVREIITKEKTGTKNRRECMEQFDWKLIDEILEKYAYDKTRIIAIMQDVQGVYRYLPEEVLKYIAEHPA